MAQAAGRSLVEKRSKMAVREERDTVGGMAETVAPERVEAADQDKVEVVNMSLITLHVPRGDYIYPHTRRGLI